MPPSTDPSPALDIERVRLQLGAKLAEAPHRRDRTKLAAAALFFEHGAYPTATLVRSVIGNGSLTDIQADLRAFWHDLRSKASRAVSVPGIPESLASVVGQAVHSIWESALDAANDTVVAVKQEASDAVDSANQAAAADRARLDEARAHIQAQAVLIEQGRAALLDSQRQVASLENQVATLAQSLADAERVLGEVQTARADLQALLAEGLDGLRKSTDKASDAFRGEINFLKMQIDSARGSERDLRDQLQSARQGRELELQVLRQQNNGLLEANGRLTLTNQELLQRLGVISK